MSISLKTYGTSSFMIVIRVTTLVKNGIAIPDAAIPMMIKAARKVCRKQHCTFSGLVMADGVVRFRIDPTPRVGDIGRVVGAIKSIWARLLHRDFGVGPGVWLSGNLLISETPESVEEMEKGWLESARKAAAEPDGEEE